jgi:hypothetical protein
MNKEAKIAYSALSDSVSVSIMTRHVPERSEEERRKQYFTFYSFSRVSRFN